MKRLSILCAPALIKFRDHHRIRQNFIVLCHSRSPQLWNVSKEKLVIGISSIIPALPRDHYHVELTFRAARALRSEQTSRNNISTPSTSLLTSQSSTQFKDQEIMEDPTVPSSEDPGIFRYVLGFLLIGLAWGFTTPFIRKAAQSHKPPPHPILETPSVQNSWIKSKLYGAFFGVIDLLRNPRYAIPLVINLTGSIWFFLLIGKAGTCLVYFLLITTQLLFLE